MSTHFSQILAEFGLRIGIPDLSMDTLGHCALQFDEVQLNLLWLQEERNVLCYAPLAIIHPDTHCELIWELMAANNFYLGTRRHLELGRCQPSMPHQSIAGQRTHDHQRL